MASSFRQRGQIPSSSGALSIVENPAGVSEQGFTAQFIAAGPQRAWQGEMEQAPWWEAGTLARIQTSIMWRGTQEVGMVRGCWRRLFFVALAVAVLVGCGGAGFSRVLAVERARREAAESAPELGVLEARIDRVSAERITLAEAGRRDRSGCAEGHDCEAPVWWVRVQGYFRYEGMPTPELEPVYEASERYFIYDARTGEAVGGGVVASHLEAEVDRVSIYAAVVRDLAARTSRHRQPWARQWPVIFIRPRAIDNILVPGEEPVEGEDVPRDLLLALLDLAPRVEFAGPEDALLPDLSTRDHGLFVSLGAITLEEDGTAVLGAEYHLGGLSGGRYEYCLRREVNGWRVIQAGVRSLA
jgi:hypothetical protein